MVGCRVALVGGTGPLSPKNTLCKGGPGGGALKIGQVLNCELLDFQVEFFKLGGVKVLQRRREHSSDVMTECIFSNFFFIKHQNLFPPNGCILPIKSL